MRLASWIAIKRIFYPRRKLRRKRGKVITSWKFSISRVSLARFTLKDKNGPHVESISDTEGGKRRKSSFVAWRPLTSCPKRQEDLYRHTFGGPRRSFLVRLLLPRLHLEVYSSSPYGIRYLLGILRNGNSSTLSFAWNFQCADKMKLWISLSR